MDVPCHVRIQYVFLGLNLKYICSCKYGTFSEPFYRDAQCSYVILNLLSKLVPQELWHFGVIVQLFRDSGILVTDLCKQIVLGQYKEEHLLGQYKPEPLQIWKEHSNLSITRQRGLKTPIALLKPNMFLIFLCENNFLCISNLR